jgi:DNA-binding LytR/AlgR family response regulator
MKNGKNTYKLNKNSSLPAKGLVQKLLLSNSDGWHYIELSNIIFCSSYNSSTVIHLTGGGRIVVSHSLKHFENTLFPFGFIRIHQSTLINSNHLKSIKKEDSYSFAELNEKNRLVIARQQKQAVMERLREISLSIDGGMGKKQYNRINMQDGAKIIPNSNSGGNK